LSSSSGGASFASRFENYVATFAVRVRYKFMGELQSLPFGGTDKLCDAGDVPAGAVDAGDETKAHRVIAR
jgi:hypothetical protein